MAKTCYFSSAWWEEDHRSFLQWIEHLSPDIFLGGHCCREVYPLHSFLMDKFSFARRLAEKPTIVVAIVVNTSTAQQGVKHRHSDSASCARYPTGDSDRSVWLLTLMVDGHYTHVSALGSRFYRELSWSWGGSLRLQTICQLQGFSHSRTILGMAENEGFTHELQF